MSNIHSIRDVLSGGDNNRPQAQPRPRPYGFGNPPSNEAQPLTNRDTSLNIGDENNQNNNTFSLAPGPAGTTAVQRIFPKFSFKSTIFIFSCVQFALFVITEVIAAITKKQGDEFDHVFACVLYRFGAKFSPSIIVYHQLQRLILPVFLHAGLSHIAFNIFSQNMYGHLLEDYYGRVKFIAIYLVAGIGGNLLSAVLLLESISVGASSALFGLFALNVAYIIENYEKFGNRKNLVLIIMIAIIAVNFLSQPQDPKGSTVDVASHIGGFITGALIAVLYSNRPDDARFKYFKIAAAVGLLAYFVVTFVVMFSIKNLKVRADDLVRECLGK